MTAKENEQQIDRKNFSRRLVGLELRNIVRRAVTPRGRNSVDAR